MATCENDLPPGDVLESSPSEALVAHNYPDSPSKVSPAPYAVITRDDRQPDSYIRASARLTSRQSSEGKLSASAVPRSRNRQDFDDSGIYENGLEPIATLGMNQLSQYTFTPTHHPEGSVDSNLAQEELRSSRDKAEFIISLKNELKKHNTIPSNFNKLGFFQELYKLLADDVWEIRNESTLLIHDLLPYLKRDLDSCVSIVLPNIVPNLGHPRTTLQKSTVQMLTSYASMTRDKQSLVEDLTAYGVNHENKNTSKNATVNLKYILNEDFSDVDMSSLAESLFRKLYDPELKDPAVASIKRLRYMVGQERFDDYLHRLTPRSRSKANNILLDSGGSKISIPTNTVEEVDEEEEEGGEEGDDEDEDDEEVEEEEEEEEEEEDTAEEEEREEEEDNEHGEDGDDEEDDDDDDVIIYKGVTSNFRRSSTGWIEFGFVDGAVMEKIRNEKDWKTRSEGCEQLRELVRNISDITPLLPHLPHFLVLLDTLIDDYNFRISMTVLDIYRILIDKLQSQLPAYLRQIVHSVMKHVGDPKVVVRIENMKVFQKLLQAAQPRLVVPILCDQLNHRVTKIREDCLNLLIYALMTHPSYEFDLSYVAEKVGPTVADPKRRVRQASLECLAVIAQFLGPARLGPLMAAVDRAEDQENLDGAMAAVQARLARRKLPKVSPDGLIEYALSIPSSTRRTKLSLPKGADVEWVMAGTGTTTGGTLSSSSSLGSSLAVSDSQVNSLSLTHPQSSPSPRSRTAHLDDSLQRKRSFSDVELNRSSSRADDRSLALWTTDTLDLSRTAPNDLGGYRGVYLGKLRQGSSYSRGISVEKGYSLLPNKYGTGGLGSARGDRPGSRSPNMMSPTLPRRINALAPLETGAEALVVTRAGSTRGIIPPLSAVSRRSVKSNHKDIISDAEEEEDDEDEDRRSRYDYEDDDEIEEEEVEEVLAEDGRSSRPKSSATTRDSGISIFSVSNDGDLLTENGSIRDEGRQQEVTSRASSRHVHSKGGSPASSIPSPNGRNSYELGPTRIRKVGDLASPSSHSLPNESLRNSGFGVVGKGYNSRSRNGTGDREFRSFDYESDFETDEEDPHSVTLSNTTLTKMKLLKKKRENQREIERRRFERDTKRSQEERTRKYRELELQHSGSSLQPTRANSGESNLAVQPNLSYKGRSPRTSPRPSPRPSPQPNRRTSPGGSPDRRARIPKSKSYTSSLNRTRGRGVGLAEKRHRSLERNVPQSNGGVPGNTYRTPQLVRRGQPPANSGNSNLSNSFGTTRRLPRRPAERSEDLGATMTTAGLRSAKPSSSCFKAHLEPFANPQEALRKAQQDINSVNWESQVDGIQDIVRLIEHHPEVIQTDLHSINMGLLKQAKNLRSQVSRASMQAFTYLFDVMKRQMEPDVEKITSLLLHKTSDTNKFLQLDSHHGLDALVENVSPNKAIPAIVHEGLTHKNPAVRTTVARLLAYEVERLGPTRALSGQKDITDRLLPAAAKLAQEGSLETRKYAKQIFQQLKQQPGFDAALKKYVPHNDIRNIQKFLDNLYNEARTIQDSARSKFSVGSRYSRTM